VVNRKLADPCQHAPSNFEALDCRKFIDYFVNDHATIFWLLPGGGFEVV